MLNITLQFLFGQVYANTGEWLMHKYILHGLGKQRASFWSYHYYEHHAQCTRHAMIDTGYQKMSITQWNTQTKEIAVLALIVLLHSPLLWLYPFFVISLYGTLALYYYKHRKAHLDAVWAKQHLPWHYDHHCSNSTANWCVTWPWFDYLMGTRIKPPASPTE